jgi:hypothetical protein
MSYSRRQLYAMGEPLGDGATRREVGGKVIYGGGGGGGNPETQRQIVDLPEWAKPYAKESLGKAQALSATPYQAYGGERIAQFTPLQKQAFGRAEGQQVAGQVGFGTGLAGLAGISSFGDQGTAASFMSPYMDAVVQQQMESAQRQADIAGTQRGAQAVRAGAFGGSRQAVENAEAARALASQKGQIQATGLQSAFERAQQQFNQEQATRLNAAQTLGQLGQQQFGQQMDITGQQAQFGGQQRQATQDILGAQYQDFLNQQRAPYDQLAFMTSMIRGTPMGQTTTMYQPAPSTTSQLVGLGTAAAGAYGAYKGAAGGEIPSYAAGGSTGITGLLNKVDSLSDAQLSQMQETQQGPLTLAAVAETLLNRQKMQEGAAQQQALMTPQPDTTVVEDEFELAGLPGLPARNLEGMGATTMADGGIVAFQAGGSSQFMQDVAEIPSRFDTYKAGLRAEDERKRLAEAESKRIRDELMEARRKQSFFNYMFGTPETAAEGRAEYKAVSEQAAARQAAPVAAQNPAAAAMQGGGTGRRAGLEDPRLQASTVSAMTKALDKPVVPTTKESVDRGTGPGAAPSAGGFAGLSALVSQREKQFRDEEQQAVNEEVAGLGKERTALEEAKEEAKKYGAEQEEKYKKRGERLDKDEKQTPYMALIDAGLAIAAGESPNALKNLAVGAQQGLKGYQARLDKVNEGRDGLEEAMFRLQNIRSDKVSAAGDKLRELNRAETKVKSDGIRALSKISEGAFNKQVDLKSKDIELAFRRWETNATANRTPAEIQLIERVMAEKKIPFSEAMAVVAGTKRAPVDTEKLRGEWFDPMKRSQINADYPNVKTFEDYVAVMGGAGGSGASGFKVVGVR